MTTLQPSPLEQLSALADGEPLGGAPSGDEPAGKESTAAYFFCHSTALHGDWNSFQVISQALRGGAITSALTGADPAFLQRLNLRLANETVNPALQMMSPVQGVVASLEHPASNDAVFRWQFLAGFASFSAVVIFAWNVVSTPGSLAAPQLSQSPSGEQVVVSSSQGLMVRDARLEELMAAHKQLGGSSLPAPSGFLRNAGFENSRGGR